MAFSLATNEKNDLYLTAGKSIATVSGLSAVEQDCEHAMKAQLAEMIYQFDQGMPYFDTAFLKKNLAQFEGYGIQTLLNVPNVQRVLSFSASQSGDVLSYTATIQTTFGTTTVTG